MNTEVKALWIDALESGKYSQSQHSLKNAKGYCCLGVLCDLYMQETGKGSWWNKPTDYPSEIYPKLSKNTQAFTTANSFNEAELPDEIFEWAGREIKTHQHTLINMNDVKNRNFIDIAKYIKENL